MNALATVDKAVSAPLLVAISSSEGPQAERCMTDGGSFLAVGAFFNIELMPNVAPGFRSSLLGTRGANPQCGVITRDQDLYTNDLDLYRK